MVFINSLLFIAGLFLLVKGSDFFVKSAASIAKKSGVSDFVIGLTIVAVGTSIPELVSSIIASIKQQSGIVIGNIVGSNIANIGLIVGITAVIGVVKTKKEMLKRDGYIMLFASIIFLLLILDNSISRGEAIVFLLFYVSYMFFLSEYRPKFGEGYRFRDFLRYSYRFQYLLTIRSRIIAGIKGTRTEKYRMRELFTLSLIKDFLILIVSGVVLVIGANYLVNSAIFFASFFKIPQTLIGISLVAVGTSLPELSVSLSAARKGYGNIVLGNILGSNIANILLVLGISAFVFPLQIIKSTLYFTAPFMIFMNILLLIFIKSEWQIRQTEGAVFLFFYGLFMAILFFSGIAF